MGGQPAGAMAGGDGVRHRLKMNHQVGQSRSGDKQGGGSESDQPGPDGEPVVAW